MSADVNPGTAPPRTTLADVARAAGVSPTSASFVLSGRGRQMRISPEAEDRVRQAASDLHYRPNSISVSLRKGITHTIGFVSDTVATTPHAGTLIKGALEAARERGSLLLIGETEGDPELERRLIQTMHDRRADAVILASMYTRKVSVPKALLGIPAVLLNALPRRQAGIPSVIPDELAAGRDAAGVLISAGFRDGIYLIGAGPGRNQLPPRSVAAVERLAGISEAMNAAGVSWAGAYGCLEWEPADGYRAVEALLAGARPKALICFNDRLALGAYQALSHRGLQVPDDVSVVSFDDDPIASWLKPQLTTLALPHYELGRRAIDILFGDGDRPQAHGESALHRVPMPLRQRASVASQALSPGNPPASSASSPALSPSAGAAVHGAITLAVPARSRRGFPRRESRGCSTSGRRAPRRRAAGREWLARAATGCRSRYRRDQDVDGSSLPAYHPVTCLISNGPSTMAFSLPGALGAKLACPDRKVLAGMSH